MDGNRLQDQSKDPIVGAVIFSGDYAVYRLALCAFCAFLTTGWGRGVMTTGGGGISANQLVDEPEILDSYR